MEQENRGESKQQMNRSQFEVGKSPFNPSLHFLLRSSSLHCGSSPLGERSEWKRWAESRSEARSAAKRRAPPLRVPPHRCLCRIKDHCRHSSEMCLHKKQYIISHMRDHENWNV